MPYSNNTSGDNRQVNYSDKEFSSLKSALIDYAKAYFPNTYQDFNETSPGMMLIEMSAYVGDVLSFYIYQQYKEMMLPLAQERRNVLNLAKTLGYKVKPVKAAFVDLTVSQQLGYTLADDNSRYPDWTDCKRYSQGIIVKSQNNSDIEFETLDEVDFTYSGAGYHKIEESSFKKFLENYTSEKGEGMVEVNTKLKDDKMVEPKYNKSEYTTTYKGSTEQLKDVGPRPPAGGGAERKEERDNWDANYGNLLFRDGTLMTDAQKKYILQNPNTSKDQFVKKRIDVENYKSLNNL